eukprot:gb/GECH01014213.1/.p1 GENE.gb/GECH01014213.1/~~gb/GECH01014213.1/.p1  ORF type:complete len:639 (+),score=144.73 gb/GECH01014213.1/:1-1917(+)
MGNGVTKERSPTTTQNLHDSENNYYDSEIGEVLQDMNSQHCKIVLDNSVLLLSSKCEGRMNWCLTCTDGSSDFWICRMSHSDIIKQMESLDTGEEKDPERFFEKISGSFAKGSIRGKKVSRSSINVEISIDDQENNLSINLNKAENWKQSEMSPLLFELYHSMVVKEKELKDKLEEKDEEIRKLKEQRTIKSSLKKKSDEKEDDKEKRRSSSVSQDDSKTLEMPLERVVRILTEVETKVKGLKLGDEDVISDLEYSIQVLRSKNLYSVDAETVADSHDNEIKHWIQTELLKSNKKRNLSSFKSVAFAVAFARSVRKNQELQLLKHKGMNSDLEQCLNKIDDWDFNVFELNELSDGQPLQYVALALFDKYKLMEEFKIDHEKLFPLLEKLENGYQNNPYHNKIHAADVLQTMHSLIQMGEMTRYFTELDVLSIIIAAIVHDYDHPGKSNSFSIKTGSNLALTYNDQSVLENHHSSSFFKLIQNDELNILSNLNPDQKKHVRDNVINMILATDISRHFDILGQIQASLLKSFKKSDHEDIKLLMVMIIKCADVSNPSKPSAMYDKWTDRVMEEFYLQGDEERKLGLTISPFMDRENPTKGKCQLGFIDFIAKPLFENLCEFDERFQTTLDNINLNRQMWT